MNNRLVFSAPYKFNGNSPYGTFKAAGDFPLPAVSINEGHTLVVNEFDHDLKDYMNRNFPLGFKIRATESSGFPHAWNEQRAIPHNTINADPRIGSGEQGKPDYTIKNFDENYGRDNWQQALPRLHMTGIRFDFFNRKMEEHYGSFNQDLIAKDISDMFVDYTKTVNNEFWNGSATSLMDTTSWEYMGVIKQIEQNADNVSAVPDGDTIADALRTRIAKAAAQTKWLGAPDVLAMNPVTYDLLCREEAKNTNGLYSIQITTQIVPGIDVPAIRTQAGTLPVVLTPFIPLDDSTAGSVTHKIVALNTSLIERIWLFYSSPLMFVTKDDTHPIANPALERNKNLINFDTYILHATNTPAHFILTKTVKE